MLCLFWPLRTPGYVARLTDLTADTLVCLSSSRADRNAQGDSDPLVVQSRDWHVIVTVALT
jgi:hypothetical protein